MSSHRSRPTQKGRTNSQNFESAPKSRGHQKLATVCAAFHFDFRDKVVLDIGSSTGGFTEYALNHGAKRVIAIEKGSHQMLPHLRHHPKVELHEKTDIFTVVTKSNFHPDSFHAGSATQPLVIPDPDIILADVSFISLTKILYYAATNLSNQNTIFLVMCKPQFEAKPYQLVNGVIKNSSLRRKILKNFENWLYQHRFLVINKRDNQITGKYGNLERFYLLRKAK